MPQVGLSLQLFVYNTDPSAPMRKMREAVVINPKILDYREAADLDAWTDVEIEGCLSSRAECCRGHIRRAKQIEVEYRDVRGCGTPWVRVRVGPNCDVRGVRLAAACSLRSAASSPT